MNNALEMSQLRVIIQRSLLLLAALAFALSLSRPWPRPGQVVALGKVESNLAVPELTPLPTHDPRDESGNFPPESKPAEIGIWYSYTTGHCGLYSPIDFDGSYWIPVAISGYPEGASVNSKQGKVRLVDEQTLEFRTTTGPRFVARLRRHDGSTWPWDCM